MTASILTKSQTKTFGPRPIAGWGQGATITAKVRYDDKCGNGHNSFTITGEIRSPDRRNCDAYGMLHDEIRTHFPELAPFLKWHLTSSDGPLYYIADTLYWAAQGNVEYARRSAVWPHASLDDLKNTEKLKARLPELMKEFQTAVESLGFKY